MTNNKYQPSPAGRLRHCLLASAPETSRFGLTPTATPSALSPNLLTAVCTTRVLRRGDTTRASARGSGSARSAASARPCRRTRCRVTRAGAPGNGPRLIISQHRPSPPFRPPVRSTWRPRRPAAQGETGRPRTRPPSLAQMWCTNKYPGDCDQAALDITPASPLATRPPVAARPANSRAGALPLVAVMFPASPGASAAPTPGGPPQPPPPRIGPPARRTRQHHSACREPRTALGAYRFRVCLLLSTSGGFQLFDLKSQGLDFATG